MVKPVEQPAQGGGVLDLERRLAGFAAAVGGEVPVRREPQAAVVAPSKPVAVLGQAADAMGGAQASESDKLAAQTGAPEGE